VRNSYEAKGGKLKLVCPQCGRPLYGATQEMTGDTGICPKCKAEFVIEQKQNPILNEKEKGGFSKVADENGKAVNFCCMIGGLLGIIASYFILPREKYCGAIVVLLCGVLAGIGALLSYGIYSLGRWISKTKLFNRLYE